MDFSQFAEHMPDGFDERYRKLVSDLEGRARGVGLYLEQASVTAAGGHQDEEPPRRLAVVASFLLGDLAFSPRVQDPDSYQRFDEPFREMKVDAEDAEWEEARRLHKEGKLGWKPPEERPPEERP